MVVDASGVAAVIFDEDDALVFRRRLLSTSSKKMSAATLAELAVVVLQRRGVAAAESVRGIISDFEIEVVPFTEDQAEFAWQAYERFGKGRHPAGLNFGDCFSYALAKVTGQPLLFKGNDFSQTDIAIAQASGSPAIPFSTPSSRSRKA